MSMASGYEALLPVLVERLYAQRTSLDAFFVRLDEKSARAQITAVLEHIGNFIATGDVGVQRAFLHTFLTMRVAEGQSPGAVLGMLVAIGDMAAQVIQEETRGTRSGADLILVMTRVTTAMARGVNDLMSEQLVRRKRARAELEKDGRVDRASHDRSRDQRS